jgi:hypothetical protein
MTGFHPKAVMPANAGIPLLFVVKEEASFPLSRE